MGYQNQGGTPLKREQQRNTSIQEGLVELDRWLQDLMVEGLGAAQIQSYSFWDAIAARMVDAQAPGLARRLRDCAGIPQSGKGWPERLLAEMGRLHLLIQGYRRIATLPLPLQAELKTQIGWVQKKSDVLALAETAVPTAQSCIDQWQVLGIRVLEDDKLWTQRVWLWGMTSDRPALILNFSYGRPDFGTRSEHQNALTPNIPTPPLPHSPTPHVPNITWLPGIILPAELVFYPSSYPLRAIVKQITGKVAPLLGRHLGKHLASNVHVDGGCLGAAIAQYGHALSQNPWLERMPVRLHSVIPVQTTSGWFITDPEGQGVPLHPQFPHRWELLALSGGHPVAIAAEWDGTALWPLSVAVEERVIVF